MRKITFLIMTAILMLSTAGCGGNSDAKRIAELEDSIAKLNGNSEKTEEPTAVEETASRASSSSSNDDYISESYSSSSSHSQSAGSPVGTYEFSDNINTWVLVVESDETAYIYNKSKGADVKCYGSWYKYSSMKYAALSFSDKAPVVWFPSGEETVRYPRINDEWIYYNSSAADAKNPEKRLPLKKVK